MWVCFFYVLIGWSEQLAVRFAKQYTYVKCNVANAIDIHDGGYV